MKMKKTDYTMLVKAGFYKNETFRRVWIDGNGNYYIKIDGGLRKVNHAKDSFVKD